MWPAPGRPETPDTTNRPARVLYGEGVRSTQLFNSMCAMVMDDSGITKLLMTDIAEVKDESRTDDGTGWNYNVTATRLWQQAKWNDGNPNNNYYRSRPYTFPKAKHKSSSSN